MTTTTVIEDSSGGTVHRVRERNNELVIKSAPTAARAAALLLIAATLFLGPAASSSSRTVEIVAFIVGTVTVLAWGAVSWRADAEQGAPGGQLLAVFALMAASSIAARSDHAGALISFALLAAIGAGASISLMGGWVIAGIGILAITAGAIVSGAAATGTLGDCLAVIVALLMGQSRRAYRIQAEQATILLAQSELLARERSQVATLGERTRIAREIHDVLAHSLGALGIQIQTARALLSEENDSEQALTVLKRAQRIATEGLDETRRAVHALRTDQRPLALELRALAASHEMSHQVPVAVDIHGEPRPLPQDASLALLRVAQEALVNAAKHSPGQPVGIVVSYDVDCTSVRVTNPLRVIAQVTGRVAAIETIDGGYGLLGMRERLLLLQGSLTAAARAGQWEVTAWVPR